MQSLEICIVEYAYMLRISTPGMHRNYGNSADTLLQQYYIHRRYTIFSVAPSLMNLHFFLKIEPVSSLNCFQKESIPSAFR